MFPLNRRAVIEYAVEEAMAAGITSVGIVIREGKECIRDYLLDVFSSRNVELLFVNQRKPLGVGHAILTCREIVGLEPFAVILPDIVFEPEHNPTRDLIEFFARRGKACLSLVMAPPEILSRYGSLDVAKMIDGVFKITYISNVPRLKMPSEKPELRGCGRAIFTPRLFEFPEVKTDSELSDGELISWFMEADEVLGLPVPYRFYDVGAYDGYVEAINALQRTAAKLKTD